MVRLLYVYIKLSIQIVCLRYENIMYITIDRRFNNCYCQLYDQLLKRLIINIQQMATKARKKTVKPDEDELKLMPKETVKVTKTNSDDAAAKARLNMIVQILPSESDDHNVSVAIKHLKEMSDLLNITKASKVPISKSPAFLAKLSIIIDMLAHNSTGDKNVNIAVETLKQM